MKELYPVIIRREPARNGSEIILFFPHDDANKGNIAFFAEGAHGEVSYAYYRACTPVIQTTPDESRKFAVYSAYIARIMPNLQPVIRTRRTRPVSCTSTTNSSEGR